MRASTALLAIVLVAGAAPGPAQERLPTWAQSHTREGNQTTRTLRAFGNCLIRLRAAAANALLASDPGSDAEVAAIAALVEGDDHPCLYQATRMTIRSRPLLRGIVAEFAYQASRPDRDALTPRPGPPGYDPGGPQWPDAPDWNFGRWLAMCTVHREPARVHALIGFNHDSPGETRTLRALRPAMLACLGESRSVSLSRLVVRALLAEALYHFARAGTAS